MKSPQHQKATGINVENAHKNAEAYVNGKVYEFAKALLEESGIGHELYKAYVTEVGHGKQVEGVMTEDEFREVAIRDSSYCIGKLMAISYALGYMDAKENKCVTKLILNASAKDHELATKTHPTTEDITKKLEL